MKIRNLAPLAIACLALWAPRIMTSGSAFGGAIAPPDPPCTHKDKPHDCSGPPTCGSIETTEETTNPAEKVRLPGTDIGYCSRLGDNCQGQAKAPSSKTCTDQN